MLLDSIAQTSLAVAELGGRHAKTERLAEVLRRAGPDEVAIAASFLSGELRQRQIGVGWAALRDLPSAADAPSLHLRAVDAALGRIGALSGPGSQAERRRLVADLFAQGTAREQRFLAALVAGELRHGALRGVMVEAVARAAELPVAEVRRAFMLHGDLGDVARIAVVEGRAGLRAIGLEVGRPVHPMLAQPAPDLHTALARLGPAAVEWKLDGARIQVHRLGGDVAVFTRTLDDITARVPEVVEAARMLPVRAVVLDGEAIALGADGRPHPFQETAGRLGSKEGTLPLTPVLFDLLHLDGEDMIERTGEARFAALRGVVPAALVVPRERVDDREQAQAVLDEALRRGHEGVMVKSLEAGYEAGRRGGAWLKVKPEHTLDLVVLAAEWGHGRRRGWLSNLHLGARDPATGGFVMLGKTFKGLTDAMLSWQTERLQQLATSSDSWSVSVRPELVVEVAFDGIQRSSRYPGGVTLRFARVRRHRPDKRAEDADTIEAVRAIGA